MTTIFNSNGFKVEFNGKATYFVSNSVDCVGHFDTERKAINYAKRCIKAAGL